MWTEFIFTLVNMIILPKEKPAILWLSFLVWLLTVLVIYYAYKGQSTDSIEPMIKDINVLKTAGKMGAY